MTRFAFGILMAACAVFANAADGVRAPAGATKEPACSAGRTQALERQVFDAAGRLQPRIFAHDVFELLRCLPPNRQREARLLERALFTQYEARFCRAESPVPANCARAIEGNPVPEMVEIPKHVRALCDSPGVCTVEYFVRRAPGAETANQWRPFGASGGLPFGPLLGHLGAQGHYEVTLQALEGIHSPAGVRMSDTAREVLADASRDADFYEWTKPAAHAQADMNATTGEVSESADKALRNFFDWTHERLDRIGIQCDAGRPREALYLLGYALHGIQDFVFHAGMSNAEHSWRDQFERRVDTEWRYADKMEIARHVTAMFVAAYAQGGDARRSACIERMFGWEGGGSLFFWEKRRLLDRSVELTFERVREFRSIGSQVDGTHYCRNCDPRAKERVELKNKWLDWYGDAAVATREVLRARATEYVARLFAYR